ncbi:hypothetical protein PPYR_08676 [Photinus pyralis]|uniref:Haemolymph juvenile hormone binding protein n=1 Tax=Photinus pyralis TaxID=7054 RepID=A0A1Y1M709_PHOPY|nr:circadian clock-controlled protein-like [Photinus pyralis]KAB0797683.1 hypothetical protein PPYR_08676 [Photinus pyralis]
MKVLTSAVCVLSFIVSSTCTIPSYIKICPPNEKYAECVISAVNNLRKTLTTGIEELNIPPMEPLYLGQVSFPNRQAGLATNLTNLKVTGASGFEIIKLVPTLTKRGHTFRIEARVPKIHAEGEYEVNTKFLQLELNGSGPFTADIEDYHFECMLKGRKTEQDGRTFLRFAKIQCHTVIGKSSIYLHNLFKGNSVLEKATNQAISENSDQLFKEVWPEIGNALSDKFTEIANKITVSFNYDELFPNI